MRILAVSDAHGDGLILQELLLEYPDCDAYFYAGDSELRADAKVFETYTAVIGNMDYDMTFQPNVTERVQNLTVFMAHGHRYAVGYGLDEIVAAGAAHQAQLIIYGHTHVALAEQHQGIVVVNPGSISQPRGELRKMGGTYALIDVNPDAIKVQFATRNGIQNQLTRTFKRA